MTFSLSQLESTADYIVNQCVYENNQSLSSEDRKQATASLLQILKDLQQRNPHCIIVEPANARFIAFFELLAQKSILFPVETNYKLMREGITYERKLGLQKIEIYNRRKVKARIAKERKGDSAADLEEQLRDMSLGDSFESLDESFEVRDRSYTPLRRSFCVPLEALIVPTETLKKSKRHSL